MKREEVYTLNGQSVVAGIAIAGPKNRMEQSDFDQMLQDLKQLSERVSGHFGAGLA